MYDCGVKHGHDLQFTLNLSMQEIIWSQADARRLKTLRLEAGYDLAQFSKLSSVSVAQITQLEEGGESLFYSPRIKYSVGKRLTLLLLRSQQSTHVSESLIDEGPLRHSNSSSQINAIVEMSRRNLDATPLKDFFQSISYQLSHSLSSKYVLSSLGMLLLMFCVWLYDHQAQEEIAVTHFEVDAKLKEGALGEVAAKWSAIDQIWISAKSALGWDLTPKPLLSSAQNAAGHGVAKSTSALTQTDLTSVDTESSVNAQLSDLPSNSNTNTLTKVSEGLEQDCAFGSGGTEITPTAAHKPGNYVYLVAMTDTVICLQDGQNKVNRLSLSTGAAQTVTGSPPWKLSIKTAEGAKIFYQGQRIQPPSTGAQVFTLVEYKP